MNSKRNFIYNFFLLSFFFIGCSNSTIEDELEMPPFNNETPSNSLCVAQFNIRYDTPEDGQYVWANRKTMAKEIITSHDFDIFGVNECLLNQLNDLLELKQYEYIGTGRDDGKEAGEFCPILYKKEWNYYIMDNFGIQKLRTSRLKVGTLFATESAHGVNSKIKRRTNIFSSSHRILIMSAMKHASTPQSYLFRKYKK